mgnify:CR=1 FL=1
MSDKHWTLETDDDGIAWLKLDKADGSANVLSASVIEELNGVIDDLEKALPAGVVVWSGKRGHFIMGADINEFTKISAPEQGYELTRQGQKVFDRLEGLPCPTVAAIDGHALGGGLELAMACDYRVAVDRGKRILGLPEVQLGIHPGFGGTVRAVKLCGVRPAMQLMLTGGPVDVAKGRRIGLVDRIATEASWRADAAALVRTRPARRSAPFVEKLLGFGPVRPFIRKVLEKQVASKARREHYPAPYAIVDLWARHGARGDAAYDAEARSIAELMCTETSRNLVRVFFLQNRLKSQGSDDAPEVRHVHVVGAGVMGGDIASWCALRGLNVTLQDREMQYVTPALERAQKLFAKRIRDDEERAAATARLVADVDGNGVPEADLIIEAIFENLEAKQKLYQSLQPRMKAGAILATNTSSIRLEELRTVLDAPERFVGLHFFNPVAMLPLVELIRCEDTERAALDIGLGFVRKIGKLPLECASAPGFVVNRILAPYTNEALIMAADGVSLKAIDKAAAVDWDIDTLSREEKAGLIVLLDQFPRNIHRESGQAFAYDEKARGLAARMIEPGLETFHLVEQTFVCLPFEHSENIADQDRSVLLFSAMAVSAPEDWKDIKRMGLDYATKHRDLIRKFGRYPHRNEMLGRDSTEDEKAFLAEHGRGF